MMDWIPLVFIAFKVLVLGTGMFFAIKWHYDQGKKVKAQEMGAVLRIGTMVAAVFALLAVGLVLGNFAFARWLGLDLRLP